jgi:hypothetical protein
MPKPIRNPQAAPAPRHIAQPQPAPAPAPNWLRPGVVVHDPAKAVDPLLIGFADELRGRGFRVAGYARKPRSAGDPPLSVDLAVGEAFVEAPGDAKRYIERAMSERADLVVIGLFPACNDAVNALAAPLSASAGRDLPMLTAIAGAVIHHGHRFVRHEGAMIAPDRRDLWRWWGPERLYDDLILGVAQEQQIARVVCGPRWLMVEGPHGVGLAHLPRLAEEGQIAALPHKSLAALAALARSSDPVETALGLAAINAHYNRRGFVGLRGDGVASFRSAPSPVAVIGAFPDAATPQRAVLVEATPRAGAYPTAALETLLPGCGAALVNSTALVNRNLLRVLRLAYSRPVGLVGLATPLTARLYDYGVDLLGGFVVHDADGLAAAIAAGAPSRDFAHFGRFVHIRSVYAETCA